MHNLSLLLSGRIMRMNFPYNLFVFFNLFPQSHDQKARMHHNFTFDIRLNRQHTLAVWKTQRAVCLPGRYILLMLGVSSSNGSSWLCSAVWGVWMPGSVSLPACSPELPASCLSSLGLWDPSDAWTGSRTERNRKFNKTKCHIHKFAFRVYLCVTCLVADVGCVLLVFPTLSL